MTIVLLSSGIGRAIAERRQGRSAGRCCRDGVSALSPVRACVLLYHCMYHVRLRRIGLDIASTSTHTMSRRVRAFRSCGRHAREQRGARCSAPRFLGRHMIECVRVTRGMAVDAAAMHVSGAPLAAHVRTPCRLLSPLGRAGVCVHSGTPSRPLVDIFFPCGN